MHSISKILSIFTCLTLWAGQGQAEVAIKWNQTEARAELKPNEEQARLHFMVTNSGKELVRIDRIETSAGNVSALIDRRIIRPNGQSKVTAIFNKGKRIGKHYERLFVYLDGESKPISTLRITVQIPVLIEARPQILYWAPNSLKTPETVNVDLDERFIESIDSIQYDPMRLDVTREADPKNRVDFLLRVVPLNFNLPLRDVIIIRGKDKFGVPTEARIQVTIRPF
ncbi:MAG: DUF1573 domain-containing protein [Verrucomicrobia bacterium]|nr:DUF1573 domain-containing protein [Verrucomicrobiota bacterium]